MKKSVMLLAIFITLMFFVAFAQKEVMAEGLSGCCNYGCCPPPGVAVGIDGCPFDTDKDGVCDFLDKCPGTPAGCAVDKDGCPSDTDKDGVIDCLDKCPNTPAGCAVDKDGCPIDTDKDGVLDCLDKCPDTPAGCKVDKNGCPGDADKDGVIDCLDKCPDTPAGCAVDKDGCPVDSDKDGVIDCMDKCPNTPAGSKVEKDGCIYEKANVTLNVEFDYKKAEVKDQYYDEIKKVADFLKEFPEKTVTIAGHTDNIASEEYNQKLSEQRANAIRQFLIDKFGIDGARITTVGYGKTKPIADNDTEEGRQKNRRVEAVMEVVKVK
jgi:OmpA-OmpF porin, OOP family